MTFEEIYKIPEDHELKKTSFRQKGTMAQDEYWEHDEIDSKGNIIFKYKSWHCTSIGTFKTNSGYEKYDAKGNLVEEHDELPL